MVRNYNHTGNYRYFVPTPQTSEELKKMYRVLAQKYHPDQKDGDTLAMATINNEYAELFEKLKNIHTNAQGETYTKDTNETPEQFINIINELIRFENVLIEIIGSFIWLSGETKPYKDIIKSLNFKWSHNKTAWYLSPEGYRSRSRKDYSMDDIRGMYGSQEVEKQPLKKLSATK